MVAPTAPTPRKRSEAVAFAQVPKFLAFEHEPYDEDKDEAGGKHEQGAAVLRWRFEKDVLTGEVLKDEQGAPKWSSNCRVVRWSDGSLQLIVGSERYDVVERRLAETIHNVVPIVGDERLRREGRDAVEPGGRVAVAEAGVARREGGERGDLAQRALRGRAHGAPLERVQRRARDAATAAGQG